jgi:hypothetical protein
LHFNRAGQEFELFSSRMIRLRRFAAGLEETTRMEVRMWRFIGVAAALFLVADASSADATEQPAPRHHGRHHVHRTGRPASPAGAMTPAESRAAPSSAEPSMKPDAHPGDRDNDGLSRNPEDCNKGCIGGNPD